MHPIIEKQFPHLNLNNYQSDNLIHLFQPKKKSNFDSEFKHDPELDQIDGFDDEEYFCCKKCKYPITSKKNRIRINDKHEHIFTNPHGYIYRIGCFAEAPGCMVTEDETDHFSWFQGYSWAITVCGQCLTLLGWRFRSKDFYFLGLILDKLESMGISDKSI